MQGSKHKTKSIQTLVRKTGVALIKKLIQLQTEGTSARQIKSCQKKKYNGKKKNPKYWDLVH